jgi:hypothetical protein
VIGDEAVAWYENHGQKDLRTYKLRMDMILRDFADRLVEEIKPTEEVVSGTDLVDCRLPDKCQVIGIPLSMTFLVRKQPS